MPQRLKGASIPKVQYIMVSYEIHALVRIFVELEFGKEESIAKAHTVMSRLVITPRYDLGPCLEPRQPDHIVSNFSILLLTV